MSIDASQSAVMADLEAVMASISAKRPVDPVVARRVQERAEQIRKRLPKTDIAVELVRDARDQ